MFSSRRTLIGVFVEIREVLFPVELLLFRFDVSLDNKKAKEFILKK